MFRNRFKESVLATILLYLFLIVAFYDVFFLGKTFKVGTACSQALPFGVFGQENNKPKFIPANGTDAPMMEEPVYQFIRDNLWKGILPLWNPHQACGFPLIGMLEIGIFFPLTFIMYLLPPFFAWDVLILSRLLTAGLLMYWFMRNLRLDIIPSLVSAICFMICGPLVLLQYWTANVDILLPLVLLACDRLIRKNNPPQLAFFALTIALTVFAGHPEHVFLVNVYVVAFFIFRAWTLKKITNIKLIVYFGLGYLLGIGLSAVVLWPFLQNWRGEFWSGHPPGTGLHMEEQADRAITLALPYFFQKESLTYQWDFAGWWGGYIGTLPLALAFMSLFSPQRKHLNYFFAGMSFLIVAKQYGLPLINWIGYLPIFSICRYAIHAPVLAVFGIAVLAGMGTRTILLQPKLFQKGLCFTFLLLVITAINLWLVRGSTHLAISLEAALFALGLLICFQVILWIKDRGLFPRRTIGLILVLIIFAELFSYIHRERPRRFDSFAKVPYIEFIKSNPERIRSYGLLWAFYPNSATGFGVDDFGYFFGLVPQRYVSFINRLFIPHHFKDDLRPPSLRAMPLTKNKHLLDLLNIKYIVMPSVENLSTMMQNPEMLSNNSRSVYTAEVNVLERPNVFPRAFIVHRAIFQPDPEKAFALLEKLVEQVRVIAVLNHTANPSILMTLQKTPIMDDSTATIIRYSPNEVLVRANMENPGLLVLSDAFHPDWRAYVDGRPTPIYQTDHLLRSVFLGKGEHQVRFVFRPMSFYGGAIISLLFFLLIGLVWQAERVQTWLSKEIKEAK